MTLTDQDIGRIKKLLQPDFDNTNPKFPNALCGTCRCRLTRKFKSPDEELAELPQLKDYDSMIEMMTPPASGSPCSCDICDIGRGDKAGKMRQRSRKRPIKPPEPDSSCDETPVPEKKQNLSKICSDGDIIETKIDLTDDIPKKRVRTKVNRFVGLEEPRDLTDDEIPKKRVRTKVNRFVSLEKPRGRDLSDDGPKKRGRPRNSKSVSLKELKDPNIDISKMHSRPKINKIVSLKQPKVMLENIKVPNKSVSSKGKTLRRRPPPRLDRISDRNQFDDLFSDHDNKANLNVCYDDEVDKKNKTAKPHKNLAVGKVGAKTLENKRNIPPVIKQEESDFSKELKNASIFQELMQEINQENAAEIRKHKKINTHLKKKIPQLLPIGQLQQQEFQQWLKTYNEWQAERAVGMKLDSVKEQPPEDMDPDIWQLVQQFQQYIDCAVFDKNGGAVSDVVNDERAAYTSWLDLGNRMVKTHRFFTCGGCNYATDKYSRLEQHMKRQEKSLLVYKCLRCHFKHSSKCLVQIHVNSHEYDPKYMQRPLGNTVGRSCKQCKFQVRSFSLGPHKEIHHNKVFQTNFTSEFMYHWREWFVGK